MSERKGLPSASGLERIALCPGSWRMEQGLPDVHSDLAAEGTLLHRALAGEVVELTDVQQELVERVAAEEERIVKSIFGIQADYVYNSEKRCWYTVAGLPLFSGQTDRTYLLGQKAIIFDYKFGYIPVTNPAENIQLRAYALLAAQNYSVSEIYVVAIQPRCKEQSVICRYDKASLVLAHKEVVGFIQRAYDSNAPLNPTEVGCKYCKAKATCPAATRVPEQIVALVPPDNIQESVQRLSDEELQSVLDQLPLAETIIDALRERAKQRLSEEPSALPNYQLKYSNGSREIKDSGAVIQKLRAMGLTAEQILGTVDIGIGSLEKVVKEVTKLKGKELKAKISDTFGDAIQNKPKAPTLERVAGEGVTA